MVAIPTWFSIFDKTTTLKLTVHHTLKAHLDLF